MGCDGTMRHGSMAPRRPYTIAGSGGVEQAQRQRFERACEDGGFRRMMRGLASASGEEKVMMIDATCLKALRTASGLRAIKGGPTTSAGAGSGERRAG